VGGQVVLAQIGFHLDDAGGEQLAALPTYQHFAQQIRANAAWVAIEEFGR
jgi:hypothetical protein